MATVSVSTNDGPNSAYTFDVSAMGGYGSLKFTGTTDFNVDLGAGTNQSQTLIVTVEGNLGVELKSASLDPTGGWSFVDLDLALSTVLDRGEQARFRVTFQPTATGAFPTELDFLTDSARDAGTFSIPLNGRVTAPRLVIRAGDGSAIAKGSAVDFGTLQLYTSDGSTIAIPGQRVFSLANMGSSPLLISGVDIIINSGCANSFWVSGDSLDGTVIAPGESESLTLNYVSSCLSETSATVTVLSNDGPNSPYGFGVSAMGGYGSLKYTGTTNFNVDLGVGTIQSQMLVFTVEGNLGLQIVSSSLSSEYGWSYSLLSWTGVFSPQQERKVSVTFQPTATGDYSTNLVFVTDSAKDARTLSIPLSGRAIAPNLVIRAGDGSAIAKGSAVDFGTVPLYSSDGSAITIPAQGVFFLANTGSSPLTISSAVISATIGCADAFRLLGPSWNGMVIQPAETANLEMNFVTDSNCLTSISATITVSSNDGFNSPYSFGVSATGGYGSLKFVGDTDFNLDLGTGTDQSRIFNVVVEGNLFVQLKSASLEPPGDEWSFENLGSPLPSVLQPSREAPFRVTFRPTPTGAFPPTETVTFLSKLDFVTDSGKDSGTFSIPLIGRMTTPWLMIRGKDGSVIAKGDSAPSLVDGTDFGTLQLYASDGSAIAVPGQRVFYLANTGTSALKIASAFVSGITGCANSFRLPDSSLNGRVINESTDLIVNFVTDSNCLTHSSAIVTVSSNDGLKNPYTFVVSGQAAYASFKVEGNRDFFAYEERHTFVMSPEGNLPITVSRVNVEQYSDPYFSGPGFRSIEWGYESFSRDILASGTGTLHPGEQATFDVIFAAPMSYGYYSMWIEFITDSRKDVGSYSLYPFGQAH